MTTYDLYAESGPMKRMTMVHVPSLAGCIARGDTTEDALAATPDAIRRYLRFLARHGERSHEGAAFKTRVVEHITEGQWLGNGAVFLPTDLQPLTVREAKHYMERVGWLHADLRSLAGRLSAKTLDAKPSNGRPIRQILQHVAGEGGYLRGVSGASRLQREAEEGRIDPLDALDQIYGLELERVGTMPREEREQAQMRGQSRWSARAALRRMLEHCWEHYVEIAERLGKDP